MSDTKKKAVGKAANLKSLTFEESVKRLEDIVAEMEEGKLSLDRMIASFEEGQTLIKECSRKLNEVEKKVETLVKKNGEIVTEPFEG